MCDLIVATLTDNKAEDVIAIPLEGKSTIADFIVIASGRSARHVAGLANNIDESLAKNGYKKGKAEGKNNGDWVLVDANDVIIHLFRPEVREFYNLEKIWCDPDSYDAFIANQDSQKPSSAASTS